MVDLKQFGFVQLKQTPENLCHKNTVLILQNLNKPQTLHVICSKDEHNNYSISIIEYPHGEHIIHYSYNLIKILAFMLCDMDFIKGG